MPGYCGLVGYETAGCGCGWHMINAAGRFTLKNNSPTGIWGVSFSWADDCSGSDGTSQPQMFSSAHYAATSSLITDCGCKWHILHVMQKFSTPHTPHTVANGSLRARKWKFSCFLTHISHACCIRPEPCGQGNVLTHPWRYIYASAAPVYEGQALWFTPWLLSIPIFGENLWHMLRRIIYSSSSYLLPFTSLKVKSYSMVGQFDLYLSKKPTNCLHEITVVPPTPISMGNTLQELIQIPQTG